MKITRELEDLRDSTTVLRKRLAEMMNNLLTDLVRKQILEIL